MVEQEAGIVSMTSRAGSAIAVSMPAVRIVLEASQSNHFGSFTSPLLIQQTSLIRYQNVLGVSFGVFQISNSSLKI